MFSLKLLTAMVAAALLTTGCASAPKAEFSKDVPATPAKALASAKELGDAWMAGNRAVETEGEVGITIITPNKVPDSIGNRKVALQLPPGVTHTDLAAMLGNVLHIPVIIGGGSAVSTGTSSGTTASATTGSASGTVYLPYYRGTVAGLLAAVETATDTWAVWRDGVLMFEPKQAVVVVVPQNGKVLTSLKEMLTDLKISDVAISRQAGTLTMRVSPSEAKFIRTSLDSFISNSAFVDSQVALITVALDSGVNQGIDWENLQIAGSQSVPVNSMFKTGVGFGGTDVVGGSNVFDTSVSKVGTTSSTTSTTTGTTTTASSSIDPTVLLRETVFGSVISGSGLKGVVLGNRFNISGVFNYLKTFGETTTEQNIMLSGVAGNELSFKTSRNVPYVSKVGAVTTANSSSVSGTVEMSRASEGVEAKLTPFYNAANNVVSIDIDLSVKSIIKLTEVNAGLSVGKVTNVEDAENKYTSSIEMRPGTTAIVGGLTFKSIANSSAAPIIADKTALDNSKVSEKRNMMFIMIRPQVTRFGKVKEVPSYVSSGRIVPSLVESDLAEKKVTTIDNNDKALTTKKVEPAKSSKTTGTKKLVRKQ